MNLTMKGYFDKRTHKNEPNYIQITAINKCNIFIKNILLNKKSVSILSTLPSQVFPRISSNRYGVQSLISAPLPLIICHHQITPRLLIWLILQWSQMSPIYDIGSLASVVAHLLVADSADFLYNIIEPETVLWGWYLLVSRFEFLKWSSFFYF